MSFHRKAFLVWLALVVSVGSTAIVAAPPLPYETKLGEIEHLIEAARAHAEDLRKGNAIEEADRWEDLAAAAQADLEWQRLRSQ